MLGVLSGVGVGAAHAYHLRTAAKNQKQSQIGNQREWKRIRILSGIHPRNMFGPDRKGPRDESFFTDESLRVIVCEKNRLIARTLVKLHKMFCNINSWQTCPWKHAGTPYTRSKDVEENKGSRCFELCLGHGGGSSASLKESRLLYTSTREAGDGTFCPEPPLSDDPVRKPRPGTFGICVHGLGIFGSRAGHWTELRLSDRFRVENSGSAGRGSRPLSAIVNCKNWIRDLWSKQDRILPTPPPIDPTPKP